MVPLEHLVRLTDGCGIWQHARHAVPDRRHGYCLDDVARALWFCARRARLDPVDPVPGRLATVYAGFTDHAWDGEAGAFRNFMTADRRWIGDEDEDASARTLLALAETATSSLGEGISGWAADLLREALPIAGRLQSPRGWAWALGALRRAERLDHHTDGLASPLARRLQDCWAAAASPAHPFFEPYLAYDSPRLAQGALDGSRWVPALGDAGLAAMRWLSDIQRGPDGRFRPPGSWGYGREGAPALHAQQPLDAWAHVEASLAAARVTGDPRWREEARRAHAWFLGENDAGQPLATPGGGCRDGIDPQGISVNQGAESTLAWLHADAAMALAAAEAEGE
ncbi:hypothetical protein [Jannaschia sp. LMIT008]|uniref:hypothetical protein n=1 Tax=Jannaschia maritima TaxID=3032585 RepID=UPI0028109D2F|nr:hypothetical protein [Jannaschia sp. LMIT008]